LRSSDGDGFEPNWQSIARLEDAEGRWITGINNSLFVSENGTLWADMAAYRDTTTNQWHSIGYPYYVNDFHILNDGSAWVATSNHLAYLPDPENRSIVTTRLFDSREGLQEPNVIALEDTSAIWVSEAGIGVSRCTIPQGFYD